MANGGLASGWPIARVFGITVRLHLSWILIFLLLTYSLATYVLPLSNLAGGGSWFAGAAREQAVRRSLGPSSEQLDTPGLVGRLADDPWPVWQYWVLAVVGTVGLFVCVLAHELAHSVVALGAGIPVSGITLFVFGGVARLRDEAPSPGAEFRMAIAGPLMSLALGLACGLLYYGLGTVLPPQARALIYYFMFINLSLVVFNLLPGFPLDGGRVLRAILWKATGSLYVATRWATMIGRILGTGIVAITAFMVFMTWDFGWFWMMLIGLFLLYAAKANYQQVALREAFSGLTVRDAIQREVVTVEPDLPLERLVDDYFYHYRFRGFPVVSGCGLVGTIALEDVQAVPRAEWPLRRVADIMSPVNPQTLVAPDENLASVFRKMMQEGKGYLPVMADGCLSGIITRHDMMTLLQIKTDLGDIAKPGMR